MTRVWVYPDLDSLSVSAADRITAGIARRAAGGSRFALALSGGSTPRALYDRLASGPRREQIPWERVHIFWGDERAVPPDHPDSNYCMANASLLSQVDIPAANIHRMRGEAEDLNAAAVEYEQTLRAYTAPPAGGEWPRFDLVLLGIGPDGHTASLFPGYPEVEEVRRWVLATAVAPLAPKVRRLTLALPALNHSAAILVLVSGANKAELVREILSGGAAGKYPAARVQAVSPEGSTIWMLDAQAASALGDRAGVEWPRANTTVPGQGA